MNYDRKNPFMAAIKERYSLCKPGTEKNTQHLVLDLKGSGITYGVGDNVAVLPENDPALVQRTLDAMRASGDEVIADKRKGDEVTVREFLTKRANITNFSKKYISELAARKKGQNLDCENFKEYQSTRELWDTLVENPDVIFTPQELCDLLMPMIPRFYSIASAMSAVGEEVHLTVKLLQYDSNNHQRIGVCTHYLCNLAPLNQLVVPIYIQSHTGFSLPEDPNTPIIMVGPGTGIAPFRAFMQERLCAKCPGKNWLFFGEWHRDHNFFYEDFWTELEAEGKLFLDLAFSRDQAQKIYVQHRMLEKGKVLYDWIQQGAVLYVCGDASRMAKDVEAALYQIVMEHGNLSEEEAKGYLKQLRSEKRYLRDVY